VPWAKQQVYDGVAVVDQTGTSEDLVIQLEDVHKIYQMGEQQVNALAGVSTSFSVGNFCAIMGPSGSGKSTMLNLLGCLDRVSRGRYVLEGTDVSTLDDDALSELRLRHLGLLSFPFTISAGKRIAAPSGRWSWPTK